MIQKSKTIDFKAPSTLGRSQNVSQFFSSSQKVTQRRAFTIHWELSQTTGEAALVSPTSEIAGQLSREPNIWLNVIFKGGKKSNKKGSHYSLGALPDYWGGSAGLSYHGCGARHTLSHATSSQRSHQRRTIPLFQTHTYYNVLPFISPGWVLWLTICCSACILDGIYIIHKVLLSVDPGFYVWK